MSLNIYNLVPKKWEVYTPSANIIPNCQGFYVGTAGVVTAENMDGTSASITMVAGGTFVGRIKKITAFGGTAGTLIVFKDA